MPVIVAPSILAADFSRLGDEIHRVEAAGADWIHCDIMDGHFVDNISFGPEIVRIVRGLTSLPLDVHLMIEHADHYVPRFVKAGANSITVHVEPEAKHDLATTLRQIQEAGCRAGLTLIDETDPLESGIEIIAQPPGKRLQSVQLLSGGEKALTAIALMFGLFKYTPSPFCLLDEIDAPLDDANIGRFVEMLQSMQSHTQFILITHNRKTMEIADRLYGVTMEEPGVSKLISVQLN